MADLRLIPAYTSTEEEAIVLFGEGKYKKVNFLFEGTYLIGYFSKETVIEVTRLLNELVSRYNIVKDIPSLYMFYTTKAFLETAGLMKGSVNYVLYRERIDADLFHYFFKDEKFKRETINLATFMIKSFVGQEIDDKEGNKVS